MKKALLKSIFSIILAGFTTLSCNKSCGGKKNDADDRITLDLAYPVETLDPRYATSAAAMRVSRLVYAPLFNLDDSIVPQPYLAEKIENPKPTTFIVTLRDNIFFHDGTPIEAKDVVYSIKDLGEPDVASPHGSKFDYLKSVTEDGPKKIIFELKEPFAPFMTDICGGGIVSKKSCLGRSQQCRHENNGSGPFRVEEWDTAKESIKLKPFDKWFEGAPAAKLSFRIVRDENTRILELIGKKADIVDSDIEPQNLAELSQHKHLQILETPGLGYAYLAFNVRGPKASDNKASPGYQTIKALADKRVRQAIARSIDFNQIIEKIFLGHSKRVSGLIPNGHWAKDETLVPPPYDPAGAEKLLDEAGFVRHGKDNMRFNLTFSTTADRTRQAIASLYIDYLRKVGINAGIRVKDWGALYEDMKSGNFEAFSAIWVPVTEPDLYTWVHHSKSIPHDDVAGGNRHGYKNAEVDRLIDLGRITLDQTQRIAIYHQIERILLEDLPYIPLWNDNRIVIINSDRIENYQPNKTGALTGLIKARIKGN